MHSELEFYKLDALDRKLVFWLIDNDPGAISLWVKTVPQQYRKNGIEINSERLYEEIVSGGLTLNK